MALVPCSNCEHPVAESAPTCPNCGAPAPAGHAVIEVTRVRRLQGWAEPIIVSIDWTPVASLGPGKSVSVTVTAGAHRIECETQSMVNRNKGSVLEVSVPPRKRLVVTVAPSRWNGKPGFSTELA